MPDDQIFKLPDGRVVKARDLDALNKWVAKNPAPEGPEEPVRPQVRAPEAAIGAAPKKDIYSVYGDAMRSKGIQPTEDQLQMNRRMVEGAMGGGLSTAAPVAAGMRAVEAAAPPIARAMRGGAERLYGGLLRAGQNTLRRTPTLVQDLLRARVPITPAGAASVAATGNRAQTAAIRNALGHARTNQASTMRDLMGAMGGVTFGFPKTTAAVVAANRLLRTPSTGSRIAIGMNEAARAGPALDNASKAALLALLSGEQE